MTNIIRIPVDRTDVLAELIAALGSNRVSFEAELKGNEFVITCGG